MSNLVLCLLLTSCVIMVESIDVIELVVDKRDSFPYPTNKSFSINIISKSGVGPISSAIANTMLILLRDDNNIELNRAIFDYGFKEMIDDAYISDYMKIPIWIKNEKSQTISISILFFRQANNRWLEIYQLPAPTMPERRQMLQSLTGIRLLLRERLNLLVPPRIQLTVLSPDERMNELMPRELGTATCRASDGIPLPEPMFVGLHDFNVQEHSFDGKKNERTVRFLVSLEDHNKALRCVAGSVEASSTIFVMHHPTRVVLEPEPGRILENGSVIDCVKADGYPTPTVQWNLITGPANASRYYAITNGGTKFRLDKDAPLRSRWTISCSSTNVIRKSVAVYNRTVTFTVGRSTEGLLAKINLTTQIIIGVVVVVAIILFSVMIVVIVCIILRCRGKHETDRTSRKNGVQVKTVSNEKGLEFEHVTLLVPDAPPSYVDLSNPEPPLSQPTYEQMSADNINPPAECSLNNCEVSTPVDDGCAMTGDRDDDCNESLKYSDVTYAEINTSNLPMKDSPSPQLSCCDDQVIYSQIVGIVSNPYNAQRSDIEPSNL